MLDQLEKGLIRPLPLLGFFQISLGVSGGLWGSLSTLWWLALFIEALGLSLNN